MTSVCFEVHLTGFGSGRQGETECMEEGVRAESGGLRAGAGGVGKENEDAARMGLCSWSDIAEQIGSVLKGWLVHGENVVEVLIFLVNF